MLFEKEQAEAALPAEGNLVARHQCRADLSKTISYQWRLLFVEECKYWGKLAKQRKKEHEEMNTHGMSISCCDLLR
ncbi:uncharacterized protein FOMMEDRAFT_92972 [Fomitiporia mediterranea MF3/22]|uniref:uncharacterized protein n=1 Tax=Fomitiporia mediterranea (strain MF3/22) TaxID=694068 RepID=UPI0004408ACE|nr:uncharacterized protein FOMMEDRAFT_92972 [Fomitiporia mediterranea MF3/22]EJC99902.1 hypothetical protein FOMMEDRAFT_92972 [Fomitiporia mediterranea MF3/22]